MSGSRIVPTRRRRDGGSARSRLQQTPLPKPGGGRCSRPPRTCATAQRKRSVDRKRPQRPPLRQICCRCCCPARRLWPRVVTGTGRGGEGVATQLAVPCRSWGRTGHGEVPHGAAWTPHDPECQMNAGLSRRCEKVRNTSFVILVLSLCRDHGPSSASAHINPFSCPHAALDRLNFTPARAVCGSQQRTRQSPRRVRGPSATQEQVTAAWPASGRAAPGPGPARQPGDITAHLLLAFSVLPAAKPTCLKCVFLQIYKLCLLIVNPFQVLSLVIPAPALFSDRLPETHSSQKAAFPSTWPW